MPFLSPCFICSHEDKSACINQFTKSWVGNIMTLKVGKPFDPKANKSGETFWPWNIKKWGIL